MQRNGSHSNFCESSCETTTSEQSDFAPLKNVVFFLQGAAGTAQAADKQNRHADRYDQRDEASAYKNPMHPALRHCRHFTQSKAIDRQVSSLSS
jgi:hypothetical protein